MINLVISGCGGKMGQVVARLAAQDGALQTVCGIDPYDTKMHDFPVVKHPDECLCKADVVIDFSHPDMLPGLLAYGKQNHVALVLATTGLSEEQVREIHAAAKEIPIFKSANMSLGVNLLINLVKKAAAVLEDTFDIEIIEKHHNQKIDAPSGTALMIADEIAKVLTNKPEYVYDRHSVRQKRAKNEIGLHAVRGGTIVGEHEVLFAGGDEIIEITHKAMSKEVFAAGAIKAAKFLAGKGAGLYDMADLMQDA